MEKSRKKNVKLNDKFIKCAILRYSYLFLQYMKEKTRMRVIKKKLKALPVPLASLNQEMYLHVKNIINDTIAKKVSKEKYVSLSILIKKFLVCRYFLLIISRVLLKNFKNENLLSTI